VGPHAPGGRGREHLFRLAARHEGGAAEEGGEQIASVSFFGAAGTVTGSRFLVRAEGGASVLVDCGLFQGYKNLRLRNWAPFPVDPAGIGAVVLTHAHLDHSGFLPLLARNGFRGRVHCTGSTAELCRILLKDSAFLQEEQARDANRYGWSRHKPALPLYTHEDAERALGLLAEHGFEEAFEAEGMRVRFSPAGHILGAAIATLECDGRTLVFSGDLGRRADPVMRPPATVQAADFLVLESTYGDRRHDPQDAAVAMGRAIAQSAARGGTVVVPCFAVGRAQAVLLHLHRLKASGAIAQALPVYLDSPMATDVTALYLRAGDEHRLSQEECRALGRVATIVRTPDESRALDESPWPKVIIAGSGMAAGGRVLHHIRRYGPDPRSLVLFTGFQAGGTRGDAMVRGAPTVKIHGEEVSIRARVLNLENLSAHADSDEIMAWLLRFRTPPGRIFLVHGEPRASDALRRRIASELGWEATVAEHLQSERVPDSHGATLRIA